MVTKTVKKTSNGKTTVASVKKDVKKQTVKTKEGTSKTDTKKISKTTPNKTITKSTAISKSNANKTVVKADVPKTKSNVEKGTIQYYVKEFAKSRSLGFESTSDKGVAFEKFVCILLEADNYDIKVEETRHSGDKGIDMIVSKSRTTSDWFDDETITTNYMVQCKYKESGKIGSDLIRNLGGSLDAQRRYKNKKAIFVTTTEYTHEAEDQSRSWGMKLIDGEQLLKMYEKAKKKKMI